MDDYITLKDQFDKFVAALRAAKAEAEFQKVKTAGVIISSLLPDLPESEQKLAYIGAKLGVSKQTISMYLKSAKGGELTK